MCERTLLPPSHRPPRRHLVAPSNACRFDPLENDPVEMELRRRKQNYVPPGMEPRPLRDPGIHERLHKPPIQSMSNRKPPSWEEAHAARVEYTREQIRLGLAPEGIERTLGPGPWDTDPAFWRSSHEAEDSLEHEMDEDIVFGY